MQESVKMRHNYHFVMLSGVPKERSRSISYKEGCKFN